MLESQIYAVPEQIPIDVNVERSLRIFFGKSENIPVYLGLIVDDGLVMSPSSQVVSSIIATIEETFEVKRSDPSTFLGIQLERDENGAIWLHQEGYVNSILEKFNMVDCKSASVPM